jgi:uncharacterized protein
MLPFTYEKARKGLAAHGVTVAHVKRAADGSWDPRARLALQPPHPRQHADDAAGPAAGHALLRPPPTRPGTEVLGTLNNCANGYTPWGTYLTCEENFNGYFGWNGATIAASRTSRSRRALRHHHRTASATAGTPWMRASTPTSRPTSRNRFGWVVEIDPFARTPSPSSAPRWAASSTRTPSW